MSELKKIKEPVKIELEKFNEIFPSSMKSDIPLLNIVTKYLLRRKGKQIRPILIFLSAGIIGKSTNDTYTAASLAELLHTATLVHDDVVDESNERRGFLSINAIWKSKIAVLVGDFLFSRGLITAVENKAYDVLEIFTNAVRDMSEGELHQIQKTRKLNIKEAEYYEIIEKKTASLLAACTAGGARSATSDPNQVSKMRDFGINLGMAFQIKDDLFDYEKTSLTGKPIGNDIQEKKLTLPLIAAIEKADKSESRAIIRAINKKSSKHKTFKKVFDFVNKYDGLEYARNVMNTYHTNALQILEEFPDTPYRKSMQLLVNYIVTRKK